MSETSSPARPRGIRTGWILSSVAILIAVGLVAARSMPRFPDCESGGFLDASGSSESSLRGHRISLVRSVPVLLERGYEVEDRFVGRVEAARSSALGFELAGTIESVRVDDGERVVAGQELARLDTARLEARRAELAATLEQAEATLALAESTLQRLAAAEKARAVSRQQLDEAMERRNTAKAGASRVRAQLDAVEIDLGKSVLSSPYAGTISAREADEGAIVNPGTPVLRILETPRLEIRAGLSADAASRIEVGGRLSVASVPEGIRQARIARILPQRDATTRTVDVILEAEEGAALRDGDLVEIVVGRRIEEPGIWLPLSALTESARGLWAAYALVPVEGEEDLFRLDRRQLELLEEKGDRVFVRGALGDGERVAATGLHRLAPGQLVAEAPRQSEVLTEH